MFVNNEKVCKPQYRSAAGASLIELIIFIIIISIAVTGIFLVMNQVTGHSADALVQKQAQAIAESMLEEVQLKNFSTPGGLPPPYTAANRASFDTVTNYNGFSTVGIFSIDNVAIPGLAAYNLAVTVVPVVLGTVPNTDAVLITVTVTGPAGFTVTATGYRTSAL